MRPYWNPDTQRVSRTGVVTPMLLGLILMAGGAARAEPYLAVRNGAKCMACHVNPSGGGKRTEFGNVYSQTTLAQRRLDLLTPSKSAQASGAASEPAQWTGKLTDFIALGGDLRINAQSTKVPGSEDTFAFGPTRAQFYLELKPLGDRLTIYLDERVAPGSATNRETYAMLWFANQSAYEKAGRLFIPFGLRIEDDTAFIRQVSGVNFNSSDDGVEGGIEVGPWSASVSVTNGAGGSAETNRRKLVSALATYVQPGWRVGVSASNNSNAGSTRNMQSAFAGLRTGMVSWLAAGVLIDEDPTPIGRVKQRVSLLEANIEPAQGHNIKLSHGYHDPNTDVREDHRARYSAVREYVPFQFTQLRLGVRKNDGIPQNNAQNATEVFAQWHAFF